MYGTELVPAAVPDVEDPLLLIMVVLAVQQIILLSTVKNSSEFDGKAATYWEQFEDFCSFMAQNVRCL